MNILLIGSGAREHALAWKLLQSPRLQQLFTTMQHAGVQQLSAEYPNKTVQSIPISETDTLKLVEFSQKNTIHLVVIGSELPLTLGLVDALTAVNIPAFGPQKMAAEIESSKAFSKSFMQRHGIPTAAYRVFTDFHAACAYVKSIDFSIVIKASGLAAGKGVFLPNTVDEAEDCLRQLMLDHSLGTAGHEIIIEERLQGQEISLLAFSDGETIKVMPPARDYKRLCDQDEGPNTGGMGAYAPASTEDYSVSLLADTVLKPAIDGLRKEGYPFIGVLYAGLMLTASGVRVLEFNCRFGDPETQVLMLLLESVLLDILLSCTQKRLQTCDIHWKPAHAVCVVLASANYPISNTPPQPITDIESIPACTAIFHAATARQKQTLIATGGRVLTIASYATSLETARNLAYQQVQRIQFNGMQYRKDIAEIDPYSAAGVNIAAGNHAVKLMSAAVRATYGAEVLAGIGAFGGMYDASALQTMRRPVLVASTDGIGTKVHLAIQAKRLSGLGHDIVNHSVNDILVQNARPLFFLDYVAMCRLDAEQIACLVSSMAEACQNVQCALLGGETAEMPGVYTENSIDVAGTIVGIVEYDTSLPRKTALQAGDLLLGIASSGPHTNGYSLIRKIIGDRSLETHMPELNTTLADALLAPHRCYLPLLACALDHPDQPIKALVHITGGGFFENIPRVLPSSLSAQIDCNAWTVPPLFQFLQREGNLSNEHLYRIFNMGIGMIAIVSPTQASLLQHLIDEPTWVIGQLLPGDGRVNLQ